MTQHEENCWIEVGIKSFCANLSPHQIDTIVEYGRLLTKDLVQAGRDARCENFDLKLENNALRVMNEALKSTVNGSDNLAEEKLDNQQPNNHLHKASIKVITSFIDNAIRQNLTDTEFVKGIIAIHDTLKQDTTK